LGLTANGQPLGSIVVRKPLTASGNLPVIVIVGEEP